VVYYGGGVGDHGNLGHVKSYQLVSGVDTESVT
jgi:hypothetical protein